MDCPYCGQELEHHDCFGRICRHQDGKIKGDIYKCLNEECDSEMFNFYFYTYRGQEYHLKEGYPC